MTSDMLADIYEALCAAAQWKYIPLPHTQCCVDELRYHVYIIFKNSPPFWTFEHLRSPLKHSLDAKLKGGEKRG